MLVQALLGVVLGATLLSAAGLKLADRTATALAAATFGLEGAAVHWIWLPLAALEAALAAGVLFGPPQAALAAAAVLGAFGLAQAGAIAAGRSGAPCGCFGARGTVSWGSVARTMVLAAVAALLGLAFGAGLGSPVPALVALALAGAAVGRARRPSGALEVAGEGPPLGSRPALGDGVELALFVSDGCRLCRALVPHAERLGAKIFDEAADGAAWTAAAVPGAPFAVALGLDGAVLAKGTVNTRGQLTSIQRTAHARGERPPGAARGAASWRPRARPSPC